MKTEFEFVSGAVFVLRAVCRKSVHLFVGPRPKDGLTASNDLKGNSLLEASARCKQTF